MGRVPLDSPLITCGTIPPAWLRTTVPRRYESPCIESSLALGYGDLGCYGAAKVKTPNIDHLASQGRIFYDQYPEVVRRMQILLAEYQCQSPSP